jgi:hypothetical protein
MAIDFFEQRMLADQQYNQSLSHEYQNSAGPLGLMEVETTDMRYQLWNMACGRTCIDNISARFGWLKVTVGQHPLSKESSNLFSHAQNTQTDAYKIYQQGLKEVEAITGIPRPTKADALWLPSVISEKYFVRDVTPALLQK